MFEAAKAGPVGVINKSSKFPDFFVAFFSSPRLLAAGLDGSEALSAASRACFSAFLAARAFRFSSSASALDADFAPLDHSFASFRSSSSRAFAIRASLAAAFYPVRMCT